MRDFGELTIKQATAYAEQYARGAPLRDAWLGEEVSATGGDPALLSGAPGLTGLWRWFGDRLVEEGPTELVLRTALPADDPQAGDRPPWHADRPNRYVGDGALWLVDAIGCHLAALVQRAFPESSWIVHRAPSKRDIDDRRTVLSGIGSPRGYADPARMVYGLIVGFAARGESLPGDDALSGLLDHMLGDLDVSAVARSPESSAPVVVPPLPGPAPELPSSWSAHTDRLADDGRVELARRLSELPGLGVEPGGRHEGRPPRPGERAVALYDDVRVLVGDEAIDGLVDRLRSTPGVTAVDRVRREYVDVVGTITDEQLLAAVIVDLALHGDP